MNTINAIVTWMTDLLLAPFVSIPTIGLLFWSAVTGVLMTYVFGKTSNQRALRRAADRVRAQLLAIKLFKEDLSVTLRCQVDLMKASAWRIFHSLPPMVVMMLPIAFLLSQLALRYEHRPLQPGEDAIVELKLSPQGWQSYKDVKLEAPEGVVVETESLRDPHSRALYWRIRPETNQPARLSWQLGDERIEKQVAIAADPERIQRVSLTRPGASLLERLLHPGEPGFDPLAAVEAIAIHYSSHHSSVLGIPWWATFFIVSILVAILIRRFLGVEF